MKFDREGVGDGSSYDWITVSMLGDFMAQMLIECRVTLRQHMHQHQHQKAVEFLSKEQHDFHVEYDGGGMIQIHRKFCQGTRKSFEKLLSEYGRSDLIPVYLEKDALNFYLSREVKS